MTEYEEIDGRLVEAHDHIWISCLQGYRVAVGSYVLRHVCSVCQTEESFPAFFDGREHTVNYDVATK